MNLFTYNVLGSPFTIGNEQNMQLEFKLGMMVMLYQWKNRSNHSQLAHFEVQNTPLILSSLIYVVTKSKKLYYNIEDADYLQMLSFLDCNLDKKMKFAYLTWFNDRIKSALSIG